MLCDCWICCLWVPHTCSNWHGLYFVWNIVSLEVKTSTKFLYQTSVIKKINQSNVLNADIQCFVKIDQCIGSVCRSWAMVRTKSLVPYQKLQNVNRRTKDRGQLCWSAELSLVSRNCLLISHLIHDEFKPMKMTSICLWWLRVSMQCQNRVQQTWHGLLSDCVILWSWLLKSSFRV